MREIAWASVKDRKTAFAGIFVAVFLASTLVTALGVLMESGLRGGLPPERYAGASVVVGGPQAVPVAEDVDTPLRERARLPVGVIDEITMLPGVDAVAGDVTVPVGIGGATAQGHGWLSAMLTPFELREGSAPMGAHDVVLSAEIAAETGLKVGDRIDITHGTVPDTYTVRGIAAAEGGATFRRDGLFFTDERVRELSGHPDQVDTVGVIAAAGVATDELAERIEAALAAHDVRTYTGDKRADVEFLDVGQARAELIVMSGAFAGTAVLIAMFVVASTLALAVHQRRREFALMRAVGATPRQVRRMLGAELTLVAGTAVLLGAGPGFALAHLLGSAFAASGMIPADFQLALSPLPAVVAIALCLLTAQLAGWVAARKPARIKPVEALSEAAVESKALPRVRVTFGWVFAAFGLVASALPLVLPGTAAVAGAAGSAMFFVISVALLGPRLVHLMTGLLAAPLRRCGRVAGYLAAANTLASSRRLAGAVTPLILAITIASVQIFSQSTVSAAAARQSADGVVADFVISSDNGGLGDKAIDALAAVDGVDTATPVIRSEVVVRYTELGEPTTQPYAAQGLTPNELENTLDLEIREGSIAGLDDDSVALSQLAAETFGVGLGEQVDMVLGDGTQHRPTVVAIYGRGLGFGDITLPHDLLEAHTATGLSDVVLLRTSSGSAEHALSDLAPSFPGLVVADAGQWGAAGQDQRDAASWSSIIALLVLLVYLGVAVVNTLVMATAEREREFALLQLIGASRRQVRRMMRTESLVVIFIAGTIGTIIAIPPLVGMSIGTTESPLPSVPPGLYLGIIGVTAALGLFSVGLPTRASMRRRPVEAIGVGA
ncbi:FtsX-like permease family protein [Haloactinopolyspora sp.]|uniref:FtsX-like permease family protein n=1 Tax=Haloactinopolyspora sp. TaxID=1966353 RepID=UPI002629E5BF|nr:FtsX-like permease family protein [Haloactinopolyspora sp.]